MEQEKDQQEKAHQDMLVVAKAQLQSREIELQDNAKNQFAEHCRAMQVL